MYITQLKAIRKHDCHKNQHPFVVSLRRARLLCCSPTKTDEQEEAKLFHKWLISIILSWINLLFVPKKLPATSFRCIAFVGCIVRSCLFVNLLKLMSKVWSVSDCHHTCFLPNIATWHSCQWVWWFTCLSYVDIKCDINNFCQVQLCNITLYVFLRSAKTNNTQSHQIPILWNQKIHHKRNSMKERNLGVQLMFILKWMVNVTVTWPIYYDLLPFVYIFVQHMSNIRILHCRKKKIICKSSKGGSHFEVRKKKFLKKEKLGGSSSEDSESMKERKPLWVWNPLWPHDSP